MSKSKEPPLTVLVVDDDDGVRTLLERALKLFGMAGRIADCGEEAVLYFRRHHSEIDVVLLDVQMPGLDGPQTLAALKQIDPNVCVVFMSSNPTSHTGEELLGRGAVAFLAKPFESLSELEMVLREAAQKCGKPEEE